MIDTELLKQKFNQLPPKYKSAYSGVWNKSETQRFLSGSYPDQELVKIENKIKKLKDVICLFQSKIDDLTWEDEKDI